MGDGRFCASGRGEHRKGMGRQQRKKSVTHTNKQGNGRANNVKVPFLIETCGCAVDGVCVCAWREDLLRSSQRSRFRSQLWRRRRVGHLSQAWFHPATHHNSEMRSKRRNCSHRQEGMYGGGAKQKGTRAEEPFFSSRHTRRQSGKRQAPCLFLVFCGSLDKSLLVFSAPQAGGL